MAMKALLRPRFLIAASALILVAGLASDYLFKWNPSSRQVLAWVRTEPVIRNRFGEVEAAAIAKQTDYRNHATGLHERKYVIVIDGSAANGRVVVVDAKPGSGHEYQIKSLD
jgi:hypothetical protein